MKNKLRLIRLTITVVIVGLFVWFLVLSPYITFKQNESEMVKAAKRYYEINLDKLPTGTRISTVTLQTLSRESYIDKDFYVPFSKEPCSITESWVKVKHTDSGYKYYAYLECGVLKSTTDHKGPTITLNGKDEITINKDEKYEEPGVKKVVDNTDGKMDVKDVTIDSSKVDTSKVGTYKVTYTALDSFKNKTEKVRTVKVVQELEHTIKKDTNNTGVYTGAVENNYVEYANMCWRIVRVTGNGAIKLVLYNYNGLTSTNNTRSSSTPCNVTGNDLAFARYEGDTYKSAFNSSYKDNAYVGLMYGTASASSYAEAQANTNASTILTNLNKWYTNVLSQQSNFSDSQLADTIWCNDKSVVTDTTFNPGNYTLGTDYGYGANINYYSASKRLVQASSFSAGGTGPSLICPNDHTGGKLSKFTVSDTTYGNGALSGYAKVGLLTADEIAFAGGAFGTSNSTYYIKGNTYSNMWWALSPNDFDGSFACVWVVTDSGSYLVGGSVGDRGGVRPSLSLQSGVKISTSGNGSATSPYKIAT